MKALRIIQFILVVVIAAYLLLLHNSNPNYVELPFFFSLPPALVIALSLIIGFLVGAMASQFGNWRKGRELKKLQKRVAELEQHLPGYAGNTHIANEPVIPDRRSFYTDVDPDAETSA